MSMNITELKALEAANFEWAVHLKSVWKDIEHDTPSIHGAERRSVITSIDSLIHASDYLSPLGLKIFGLPGAGKTHMLGALRKHVFSRSQIFILVDMTDVRDFWETVNQGYLTSLDQASLSGGTQLAQVLNALVAQSELPLTLRQITDPLDPGWKEAIRSLLMGLVRRDRASTRKYADVIRAAILFASDDFDASGIAQSWLQGIPLDESDCKSLGLARPCCTPMEAVEGLSWLIGLNHCTVLALDQLDSIVMQHSLVSSVQEVDSDEQKLAQAIIEGIAGGLSGLRDKTCRTLSIITCIRRTWEILSGLALSSFQDRFKADPILLAKVYETDSTTEMVASRLAPAYLKFDITPPYSTWPYAPSFFLSAEGLLPREVLKHCDVHRRRCLEHGEITELTSIKQISSPATLSHALDPLYEQLVSTCSAPDLSDENQEDGSIASLLQFAVFGLALELDRNGTVEHEVDTQFGGWRTRPLHARIRQILHAEGDDERHLSLRVLLRSNARAYTNRIKLAMTEAGIDKGLRHRHLILIRNSSPPTGRNSQSLTQQFHAAGGEFVRIGEDDLRRLEALRQLRERNPAEFEAWQQHRRPFSQLAFLRSAVAWLEQHGGGPNVAIGLGAGSSGPGFSPTGWPTDGRPTPPPPPPPPQWPPTPSPSTPATPAKGDGQDPIPPIQPVFPPVDTSAEAIKGRITVGFRWSGQQLGPVVTLAPVDLGKHTVVLAGAGSGKTVLVRRMVEEAALQGIPSIVIDGANDLARLGDRWEEPPDGWYGTDPQKAEAYHRSSEVIVWTPGAESGNPLQLNPLPDFSGIEDREELDQATDMARDALQDIVASGSASAASIKRGILKAALNLYAESGGRGDLEEFMALLLELPPEACEGFTGAARRAQDMAGMLRSEVLNNPLLRQAGHSLDPAILLGVGNNADRARISVISLCRLQGLSAQRQFLNQLFMTLFTWIRKNPPPPEIPLRALLVLDEAKDFVPARESTACKSSFNRLVAQARKYGLGIVVATQAPRSIDHNVIANCSTQFYGRANSPAAIEVVSEAISQRGGIPDAVSRLKTGQFYISSVGLSPPVKILTPNCLSYHPPSPLSEEEVIMRAARSRRDLSL